MSDNVDRWVVAPSGDMLVCVPCKNGGVSFYRHVFGAPADVPDNHARRWATERGMRILSVTDVRSPEFDGVRKILAVRDPVLRFASLWRDKCRDCNTSKMTYLHGMSPDGLLAFIRYCPDQNPHWIRQSAYAVPGMDVVGFQFLPEIMGYPFGARANATSYRREDPAMPEAGILAHYALDNELWMATSCGRMVRRP